MRLLLVRHGQSRGNVEGRIQGPDDPLNDVGRGQARAAARVIAARSDVTHLYASPLERAMETASIIGAAIGVKPQPLPGLAEISAGVAAGMLWTEWSEQNPALAARMQMQDRALEAGWEGGETGHTFSNRVLDAYDELVTRHLGTDDIVVAVSHGGPLAWISARLHGDPLDAWPSSRGVFLNCSITELEIDRDGATDIIALNGTAHLDQVLPD